MNNINLTEHFTLEEMVWSRIAEEHGIDNNPNKVKIGNMRILCEKILEPARSEIGMPITITSGYRSDRVNKVVGGANGSLHVMGLAADITCADNPRLYEVLQKLPCFELIRYMYNGRINRFHVSFNGIIGKSSHWSTKWT